MLKLGTATASITPKAWEGITMDGMPRIEATRGVLDDLQADVFVLQDGRNTVVIATLDQVSIARIYISERLYPTLRAIVDKRLPDAQLILCATHNHSSLTIPVDANNAQAVANCAAAREVIYEGFSSALELALQEMREVEVAARRIPLSMPLGQNRRAKLGNGSCTMAWGAGPLILPGQKCVGKTGGDAVSIDMIAFREPGAAEPMAILSSYASHVHFYEVPCFTGEAPGGARRAMRRLHPNIHLMYSLGFAGDNAMQFAQPIPKDDEESRIQWQTEKTAEFGEAFSKTLSDHLTQLHYAPVDSLHYISHYEQNGKWGPFLLVESLRVGSHAICSMPGELFIELEKELRDGMPCETLLPMTYNRTELGYVYIATPLAFEEGGYETMHGPKNVGTDTGDVILKKVREQLQNLFCR